MDFWVGREHLKYHLDGIWTDFGQFLVYNCGVKPQCIYMYIYMYTYIYIYTYVNIHRYI